MGLPKTAKRTNINIYRRKMPSLSSSPSQGLRSVSVMFSLVIIATLATLLLTLTTGVFAADATEDRRLGTTVELIEGDNYFVEEESFEMEDQDMPDDEMDNNQAVRASGGHEEDELDEEEEAGVIDEEDNYFDESEEDFE